MIKLSKRQVEIVIGVFALLLAVGLLLAAEFSNSTLIKIPVFKSIWMVLVYAWQFFWGFVKMFWTIFTSSWLSVVSISGIVIFIFLGSYYRRHH